MGKVVGPPLTEETKSWIAKQKLFFVASAPKDVDKKVNVSPKTTKELHVLEDFSVAYLDLTGSGSETSAHILENGRLTMMFVALKGAPKIVRLYGTGEIWVADEKEVFCPIQTKSANPELRRRLLIEKLGIHSKEEFGQIPGSRSVIVLNIERVADSCGFSIPKFEFVSARNTLDEVSLKTDMDAYQRKKNAFSIDALPSIAQHTQRVVPCGKYLENGFWMATYDEAPKVLGRENVEKFAKKLLSLISERKTIFLLGFLLGFWINRGKQQRNID